MGKIKATRVVTEADINCLENFMIAYNTVFLMSSIFIVSVAGTTQQLFSDFHRILSPSLLLLVVGGFIVLIASIGYFGVAKKSSTLISTYTLLIIFVLVVEIIAGLGILSFRGEIKSMITSKMKRTMIAYPHEPLTANLVDYVQLELRCCGINNYRDWNISSLEQIFSNCIVDDMILPQSCCNRYNSTLQLINQRGCFPALNFMLHKSSLLLSTAIIVICTIQILGAYFSYSLSSSLNKFKIQKLENFNSLQNRRDIQIDYREKSNYF